MTQRVFILLAVGILSAGVVLARDADQQRTREQAQDQQIYGSQMMTPEERSEFRDRMRAAETVEERERIRQEHHERMKSRAMERGIELPDEPPERGKGRGMGPGGGMGGGRR